MGPEPTAKPYWFLADAGWIAVAIECGRCGLELGARVPPKSVLRVAEALVEELHDAGCTHGPADAEAFILALPRVRERLN